MVVCELDLRSLLPSTALSASQREFHRRQGIRTQLRRRQQREQAVERRQQAAAARQAAARTAARLQKQQADEQAAAARRSAAATAAAAAAAAGGAEGQGGGSTTPATAATPADDTDSEWSFARMAQRNAGATVKRSAGLIARSQARAARSGWGAAQASRGTPLTSAEAQDMEEARLAAAYAPPSNRGFAFQALEMALADAAMKQAAVESSARPKGAGGWASAATRREEAPPAVTGGGGEAGDVGASITAPSSGRAVRAPSVEDEYGTAGGGGKKKKKRRGKANRASKGTKVVLFG